MGKSAPSPVDNAVIPSLESQRASSIAVSLPSDAPAEEKGIATEDIVWLPNPMLGESGANTPSGVDSAGLRPSLRLLLTAPAPAAPPPVTLSRAGA